MAEIKYLIVFLVSADVPKRETSFSFNKSDLKNSPRKWRQRHSVYRFLKTSVDSEPNHSEN
jgi:hypothetical protein